MKFRKKPVVIEAVQYTGLNIQELKLFTQSICLKTRQSPINPMFYPLVVIPTLEGNMTASKGDWIIKGVNGEFYPCKPDIFEKTYEPV